MALDENIVIYGTTSACAENTQLAESLVWHPGNYLRMRGEYTTPGVWCQARSELPPHARRIHCP